MRALVNGAVTRYELNGPADAPVITFSHSLASSLEMWEPQLAAFTDRFRVLRYDTRGHGGSEVPPGPYTLEMLADDIRDLLGALEIPRTHFVGLSMGGMIGQTLALRHPDRIRSLVLADTSSRVPPEAAPLWDERIQSAKSRGMAALAEATVERWFTPGFRKAAPETVERIRMLVRTTAPEGYAGCARAIEKLDCTARLGEIQAATLVIVGAQDEGTPEAVARTLQEGIPGAELIVLEQAAHLSNIEQASAFNAAVGAFLDARS